MWYPTRLTTTVVELFSSFQFFKILMNAKKKFTIVTWTLIVKTQMDPLCVPVYLDLTEMDGTA